MYIVIQDSFLTDRTLNYLKSEGYILEKSCYLPISLAHVFICDGDEDLFMEVNGENSIKEKQFSIFCERSYYRNLVQELDFKPFKFKKKKIENVMHLTLAESLYLWPEGAVPSNVVVF